MGEGTGSEITGSGPYVSEGGSAGHDGGLVDGHGVLGVVRHDGVARLVVGRDLLVLLVDVHAAPLRPCGRTGI